jgi:hypothetical protein
MQPLPLRVYSPQMLVAAPLKPAVYTLYTLYTLYLVHLVPCTLCTLYLVYIARCVCTLRSCLLVP